MKDADFPVIETERLILALPSADAALRVLAFVEANREHLSPWSPSAPDDYYTEAYWRASLQRARDEFQQDQSLRLVMFEREHPNSRVIGMCNFSAFIRGAFQACYLGYNIDCRMVGRGLMFEALSAAIKYVFDELRLHRIMANYLPTNERSGRLLRRLGFTVEGYASDYLLIAGEWRDHILTSLTNTGLKPEGDSWRSANDGRAER